MPESYYDGQAWIQRETAAAEWPDADPEHIFAVQHPGGALALALRGLINLRANRTRPPPPRDPPPREPAYLAGVGTDRYVPDLPRLLFFHDPVTEVIERLQRAMNDASPRTRVRNMRSVRALEAERHARMLLVLRDFGMQNSRVLPEGVTVERLANAIRARYNLSRLDNLYA